MPNPEKDVVVKLGPFTGGLHDSGDKHDTPPDAFREVLGFQWMDADFPNTQDGRLQHTGPQIVTSKAVSKLIRWRDQSGTSKLIAVCDGSLYSGTEPSGDTGATINTLINKIDCGQTGCTRNADTVTLYGSAVRVAKTLKTGTDRFWFTADGIGQAATIQTLIGDTGFTVSTYGGAETSATNAAGLVIERHLGSTVDLALFDGRIAVTDGVLRWHWYGATADGGTTYIFREHGLEVPSAPPTLALAAGGALSAGDYTYWYSVEDPRGVESTPVKTRKVTAAADNKTTFSALPNFPKWATKANVYRTVVNGSSGFNIVQDIPSISVSKTAAAGGTSTWTLFGDSSDTFRADQHKFRRLKFQTTGNSYVIKTNGTNTFNLFSEATDEAATTNVGIFGGFDLDYAATGGIVDLSPDTELDFFNPAPTEALNGKYQNDQGSTAASNITAFRADGRLAWVVNNSRVEFSGRPFNVNRRAGVPDAGEGRQYPPEFEYSQVSHAVNANDNVPIVRLWSMGPDLYAGREEDIWGLEMPGYEVTSWNWEKRSDAYGVIAKDSIAVLNNNTFFLANDSGSLDIVMFNGYEVLSVGRERLDDSLDEIVNPADATGVIYSGTYLLSYSITGSSTHNRLLGYYTGKRIFDKQPWGCGTFLLPYRAGNSFYLYCAAPTAVGHIYEVFGSEQDLGNAITRLLRTGAISKESPYDKVQWAMVETSVKGP